MTHEISVGVVGCGYWGPNLARNFASLPLVKLAAVCDSRPSRLAHMRELHPQVAGFDQFGEFILSAGVDAVAVATGAPSHFEIARACLAAGKHVCIEKPMAMNCRECDELIQLAAERSLVLMVGHTFLYSPAVRKVREIIASGEIGEVRHVSTRRLNLGIVQKDVNVVWDLAPHDLSIILAIFGESPQTVNCHGSSNLSPTIQDVAFMWLTFSKNRSATIESSWLNPLKTREVNIVGTRKMIAYDDVAGHNKIRVLNSRVEIPPYFDTFAEFQFAYHYGDVVTPNVLNEEPLKLECQHFIDCVRDRARPLTDGAQGREIVRIIEAANQSLSRGGLAVSLT